MIRISARTLVAVAVVVLALALLPRADIHWVGTTPGTELARFLAGFLAPAAPAWPVVFGALATTLGIAVVAVGGAHIFGLLLALVYRFAPVRWFCAAARAVHELFWALLLMQVFGISMLTGVLALFIPYSAMMARVYHDLLDEVPACAEDALPASTPVLSRLLFSRLPQAWAGISDYLAYRTECAIRSSTILGFIGLPTIGFYLDSAIKQGIYDQSGAWIWLTMLVLLPLRRWVKPQRLLLLALVLFGGALITVGANFSSVPMLPSTGTNSLIVRFLSEDIWPHLDPGESYLGWLWRLWLGEGMHAIATTFVLTQLALLVALVTALGSFPWLADGNLVRGAQGYRARSQAQAWVRGSYWMVYLLLLFLRAFPEIMLAFILVLIFGPSMLPAIIALGLHNGAVVAHLTGHQQLPLRDITWPVRRLDRFAWILIPAYFNYLLAYLLYRWEIIFREATAVGLLGVVTLGFYIDSAFEDMRLDRAFALIGFGALINILLDALSRRLRHWAMLRRPNQRRTVTP